MSSFNLLNTTFFTLLLISCKSQGIVTEESIVSSRHFIVELYDDDYEFAGYTCEDDFGSGLSSIRSQEEQNEINELILGVDFSEYNIWIGYSNNGGTFSWEDSSTSTYTNWCANQPNTANDADCAQITSTGCWIAAPCDEYHNPLCRRGNILYSSNSNYVVVQGASLVHLDAQAFCRDTIGSDLATVTTNAEQEELLALLRQANVGNDFNPEFYLGLNDRVSEGSLSWTDGTNIDNTFINNKLCNTNNGNQDCVWINEDNGCWNFHGCNRFFQFACNNPRSTTSNNYVAVDARFSFLNANEYCKDEFGTSLATITSSSQNIEVSSISYKTSWIGYNDINSEGNFVWLSGSGSGSYTNWRTNEPNNFGKGEDCTIIYKSANVCPGCWNDIDCLDGRAFVCNKS